VIGINLLDVTARLFIALVLGGLIGLERERQERAAGLRTVTMVSLGSCLFTLVSAYGFQQTDPSRVAAQIVTGIGFLGAGAIFMRKDLVRGLTTAATIWATAAIGMAAALGQFFAAFLTTLLILIVLMVLKPVERRFFRRHNEATLTLTMGRRPDTLGYVQAALEAMGASVESILLQEAGDKEERLQLLLEMPFNTTVQDVLQKVRQLEGVSRVAVAQTFAEDQAVDTPG
jgi:putative Mg2+ transporter-C (MgtC) family protein